MTKNTGKFYKSIEDYVNFTVAAYLVPIGNIESIKCKRVGSLDKMYIELVHEDSDVRYFDATGMSMGSIGIMVGHIIANRPIRYEITDREAKREVRKAFR